MEKSLHESLTPILIKKPFRLDVACIFLSNFSFYIVVFCGILCYNKGGGDFFAYYNNKIKKRRILLYHSNF